MKLLRKIKNFFIPRQGVALFISILMSMSLAVIAVASMDRLSEASHTTGKSLQDRRLMMYAQSAANIVSGQIQVVINEQLGFADEYEIYGIGGEGTFRYYPRDVYINPDISGVPTLFGYRARARLFAGPGDSPPGLATGVQVPTNGSCYDITIDVREVLYLPSGAITPDENSKTTMTRYYLGKMKTVGIISCYQKG